MKKENNISRFVYPMNVVNEFFTDEEIEKMSESREFDKNDEFFHFDEDEGWIESLNESDFNAYNGSVPTNKILLKAA